MRARNLVTYAGLVVALVLAPAGATRTDDQPRLYLAISGALGSVSLDPPGDVTECPSYCKYTFPVGTQSVTLTAQPGTGGSFLGWSKPYSNYPSPCTGTAPTCVVDLASVSGISADFSPVVLRLNQTDGGTVTLVDHSQCNYCLFDYGSWARLRATPAGPNYAFDHWNDVCVGVGPACRQKLIRDRVGSASFKCVATCPTPRHPGPVIYRLTVGIQLDGVGSVAGVANGLSAGIDCPSARCSTKVGEGTVVSVVAKPAAGQQFAGWTERAVSCPTTKQRCTFKAIRDPLSGSEPMLTAHFVAAKKPPKTP